MLFSYIILAVLTATSSGKISNLHYLKSMRKDLKRASIANIINNFLIASLLDDWGCLGNTIALRTHHGKYVVAESNGDVNADRKVAYSYETFEVKELGGNKIALKSHHGKYMVAEEKSW